MTTNKMNLYWTRFSYVLDKAEKLGMSDAIPCGLNFDRESFMALDYDTATEKLEEMESFFMTLREPEVVEKMKLLFGPEDELYTDAEGLYFFIRNYMFIDDREGQEKNTVSLKKNMGLWECVFALAHVLPASIMDKFEHLLPASMIEERHGEEEVDFEEGDGEKMIAFILAVVEEITSRCYNTETK